MRKWISSTLALLAACNTPVVGTTTTTTGITSVPDGSTAGSSSSGGSDMSSNGGELSGGETAGETSGSSSGATTLILDVGTDKDVDSGQPAGCKGKIDFLFVIFRYGGMEGYQALLLDAFPKFIDMIEAKFADFDYHIMVVDGGGPWGLVWCEDACPMPCEAAPGYPCNHTPTPCDQQMGAGVVIPAGELASNVLCPIDGGRRYMVKGQSDLKETFACVAQVGVSGAAMMGEAVWTAVQPWLNGPGDCNDGFLRDDALLVVTQIANTYDGGGGAVISQMGTPKTWAEAVLAAKHGDLESIVMLSILHDDDECDPIDRTCKMVKMFPYHVFGERDAPDYGPYFDQATDLVETACEEFIPPG